MRRDGKGPGRRAVLLGAVMTLSAAVPDLEPQRNRQRDGAGAPDGLAQAPADDSTTRIMDGAPDTEPQPQPQQAAPAPSRTEIINTYAAHGVRYWGLEAPGVLARLPVGTPGIALTIDFCGGPGGNGYDQALLDTLRQRHVPATLFLNSRWISANPATARQLAADPLFELANHGTSHKPLSTTGNSAYGIPGTRNAGEVYDEIMPNDAGMAALTGARPRYFRPGTAYMDDVAADILRTLGVRPAGFSVNGDGGATFPAAVVAREVGRARGGDIVICHGNHPGGGTAEGVRQALDRLLAAGSSFQHLP